MGKLDRNELINTSLPLEDRSFPFQLLSIFQNALPLNSRPYLTTCEKALAFLNNKMEGSIPCNQKALSTSYCSEPKKNNSLL
jgi:hypothetical protein